MSALALLLAWLPVGLLSAAYGADWVSIQGTEPSDPDSAALRPWGFIQVLGEGIVAQPVPELDSPKLADFAGQRAVFNTVANQGQPSAMTLRRARIGLRGDIPGTGGAFSTFAALELGQNGVTTAGGQWQPALMDASITYKSPWPVHLRVGQFKSPTSDATLESVHMSADLLQFSVVSRRLLLERPLSADADAFAGRATGYRDVGAQIFGSHMAGPVELSWLVMGSNGSLRLGDDNPGKDVTVRAQASYLLGDGPRRSPTREELSVWGWGQSGSRLMVDGAQQRTRAGGGGQYLKGGVRVRGEYIWASGVLNTGFAPPFAGGTLLVSPEGQAWGTTAVGSYRYERLEVGVHWAHLDSQSGEEQRLFDEVTGFAQWHISSKAWVNTNVMWRQGRAPQGSADAQAILGTMAPYMGLELTVIGG